MISFLFTANRSRFLIVRFLFLVVYGSSIGIFQCFTDRIFCLNMGTFFVAGTTAGWSTAILPIFEDKNSPYTMSSDQIGWILSIGSVGITIGPILTWLMIDRIGRKTTIVMCPVPMIISYVIMFVRMDYPYLLIARALGGIGMGVTVSSVPLYIGEITDDGVRGAMGVFSVICQNLGNLFCIILTPCVSVDKLNMICAILSLMLGLSLILIPESPYYYLMKGDEASATESMIWLRRTESVSQELTLISEYLETRKLQNSTTFDLVTNRTNRRAFTIATIIMLMQVYSGVLAIPTYAYEIFQDSNYNVSLNMLVLITGLTTLVVSFVGIFVIDTIGRRAVLFFGSTIMFICLIVIGIFDTLKYLNYYDTSGFNVIPFLGVLGYIVGFSFGHRSLSTIVLSEYFSTSVKAKASMFLTIGLAINGLVAVKIFQILYDHWGHGVAFFICSVPLAVGTMILYFIMPETRGCSLRAIENMHSK